MTYFDYMKQISDKLIVQDEDSQKWYINPDWIYILHADGLEPEKQDIELTITEDEVKNRLELEVKRRNLKTDKTALIANWLYTLLTTTAEPALTDAENQLAAGWIEYMKDKDHIKEQKEKLDKKEEALEQKQSFMEVLPGMNFAKRKP